MATVVDAKAKIDWDTFTPRTRFPWAEWTNGETYQAIEGADFHGTVASFKMQLRKRAESESKTVKLATKQDKGTTSVFFQFS